MSAVFRPAARAVALAVTVALGLSAAPAWGAALSPSADAATWGTDGQVAEILPLPDGSTVIAGSFANVVDPAGGLHPAANVAKLDRAGVWVPGFAAVTDGAVAALAYSGGRVYLGGAFNKVDGAAHRKLAAVDAATGALDRAFAATADGQVSTLTTTSSHLYVGGAFLAITTPAAGAVARMRVAKLALDTGVVDPLWSMHPDGRVRSLVASSDGETLYAGGDFLFTDGAYRPYAAAYLTAGSGGVTAYDVPAPDLNWQVFKQVYLDGNVYIAGNGPYGGVCLSVDGQTGATNWSHRTDGNVQAIAVVGGVAYCGGHFTTITSADVPRQHIAAVDLTAPGAPLLDWAPRVNSAMGVWAMAGDGSRLLIGGDFTRVGRTAYQHYASFTP